MDWVNEQIAIGNIEDVLDTASLKANGVTAILCLNWFPLQAKFSGFDWHQVNLIDGEGNSLDDILCAVERLETLTRSHKVLVHCAEGISRSPFIVACYLARAEQKTISTAIAEVAEKRPGTSIDAELLKIARFLEPQP